MTLLDCRESTRSNRADIRFKVFLVCGYVPISQSGPGLGLLIRDNFKELDLGWVSGSHGRLRSKGCRVLGFWGFRVHTPFSNDTIRSVAPRSNNRHPVPITVTVTIGCLMHTKGWLTLNPNPIPIP